jgi:hypothetical protein
VGFNFINKMPPEKNPEIQPFPQKTDPMTPLPEIVPQTEPKPGKDDPSLPPPEIYPVPQPDIKPIKERDFKDECKKFIHIDETRTLRPLHIKPDRHQIPETFPFGV